MPPSPDDRDNVDEGIGWKQCTCTHVILCNPHIKGTRCTDPSPDKNKSPCQIRITTMQPSDGNSVCTPLLKGIMQIQHPLQQESANFP